MLLCQAARKLGVSTLIVTPDESAPALSSADQSIVTALDKPGLAASAIYRLLHGYSPVVLTANLIAADSPVVRQHIRLFLDKLRYVKPSLTGEDLKKMGIPAGPRIREILDKLRDARLDGKVKSKREEEGLVGELARE